MAPVSIASAILLLLATATVRADPAAPLSSAEQQSLDAFAAAHKDCTVWSDSCVICRRLQEAAFACSTPGIACQPTTLACRNPARDKEPAEASKPVSPMTAPKGEH